MRAVKIKKLTRPLDKVLSYLCREKDDCWNTACLNRNCFEEAKRNDPDFSWSEKPLIFGEKDLIDDFFKGKKNVKLKCSTVLNIKNRAYFQLV